MGSHNRILCVEDNEDFCELVSYILKEYKIVNAKSVEDGLRLASSTKFLLYLVDYHLPDKTGLEFVEKVRTFDKQTPIFLVTGETALTKTKVIRLGGQELIDKNAFSLIEDLKVKAEHYIKNESRHASLSASSLLFN